MNFTFAANAAPAQAISDTPRTEDLEAERLHIASRWSIELVPYGEVPTDRRRQDLLALREPARWKAATLVAGARRARPRGRMTWADLLYLIQTQVGDQRCKERERGTSAASTSTQHRKTGKK